MLVALLGMTIGVLWLASFGLFIFNWIIAFGANIFLFWLFLQSGKLQLWYEKKAYLFNSLGIFSSKVIYGDIEDPSTAMRLKFIPEDIGGIFVCNEEVILGTLYNERRCNLKDFQISKVKGGVFANHLKIKFLNEEFAFFPKWNGMIKDAPATQLLKVEWALAEIKKMTRHE